MKKQKDTMKGSRHNTSWLAAAFIPLLLLTSCLKDRDTDTANPLSADETPVKFSIRLPGTSSSGATRALQSADETRVKTIDVLVFGANGGNYIYTARCSGSEISTDSGNPSRKTFTATMRLGSCDIVLLANARDIIPESDISGKPKSQVLGALTASMPVGGKWLTDTSDTDYEDIPLWGELNDVLIEEDSRIPDTDDLTLTRMMARVDVEITGAAASVFKMKTIDVYNYNTDGTPVPASSGWNAVLSKATAPNVPAASVLTLGPVAYGEGEIDDTYKQSVREIYIFEAENHSDAQHQTAKANDDRTCLVVGGLYGNDTKPSYYRMDFSTGTGTGEVFLDVLRNHHYTFSVTKVANRGHDESIDAFYGLKKIEFTVDVMNWGDQWSIPLEWNLRGPANSYMVDSRNTPFAIPAGAHISSAMSAGATPGSGLLPSSWMDKRMELKAAVMWSDADDLTGEDAVVEKIEYYPSETLADCKLGIWPGQGKGNSLVILYEDNDGADGYQSGATDKIVWSWHIWNAGYYPYGVDGKPNVEWMDRNLGALKNRWTSWTSSSNFSVNINTLLTDDVVGMHYQWGRKDPFPAKVVGGIGMSTNTDNTLVRSVTSPAGFITNWSAPAGSDSWGFGSQSRKTVYDPCPEGWKVPSNDSFGSASDWSGAYESGGMTFDREYYPLAGGRNTSGGLDTHAVASNNISGKYWTDRQAYALSIDQLAGVTGTPVNSNHGSSNAFSIRCVADE